MISEFVREQKRYTQKEICHKLKCSEEEAIPLIRKLKEFSVLKTVKASDVQKNMTDLSDEDIEAVDVEVGANYYFYVFTFVGVIVVAGRVLKCYPKYLLNTEEPTDELRQVIKVLEKCNSKEQIVRMFNDSSESSTFNLLAVLLFLLRDYFENGVYSNTEDIIESNGSGDILWDKTINETFTLLSGNRPYYTELQTRKRVANDYDYFRRLHECILTIASKELGEELLDLFETIEVDLSDEELDDFGDTEYILYRIENELNTQFNTRKQLVLKTIYAYIDRRGTLNELDCMSLFGTNSFNLVWEKVCAEVMDNQLHTPINRLGLDDVKIPDGAKYTDSDELISVIEKPKWQGYAEDKSEFEKVAKKTLTPDLISIYRHEMACDFVIFDAKYYTIQLEQTKELRGQPGVSDVTKQYLYQLAYKEFVKANKFNKVKNCFLMPTEEGGADGVIKKGSVKMDMLAALELEQIQVRQLAAKRVFHYYLASMKVDIGKLDL